MFYNGFHVIEEEGEKKIKHKLCFISDSFEIIGQKQFFCSKHFVFMMSRWILSRGVCLDDMMI